MKKGQIACLNSLQANHAAVLIWCSHLNNWYLHFIFAKKKSTPLINGFGQIHQYPMIFASFNWMKSIQCCFVFDGCMAVKIMVTWFHMSEKSSQFSRFPCFLHVPDFADFPGKPGIIKITMINHLDFLRVKANHPRYWKYLWFCVLIGQ